MVYEAGWGRYVVQISRFDAGRKTENSCLERLDVAFEGAVFGVQIAVIIEPVTLFRRLAIEEALGWDVGHSVVVVDVAIDASAGIGHDAIAKRGVADARASEGVERDAGVGKPAVRENGESGAEAVTGETDLRLRILPAIVGDCGVNLLPYLIQGVLKASVNKAWLGEEVADEGQVSQGRTRVPRNGAIVGFVDEQDVGVGEEIVGIVPFGAAEGA
jgi:hypothetical protein